MATVPAVLLWKPHQPELRLCVSEGSPGHLGWSPTSGFGRGTGLCPGGRRRQRSDGRVER